MAVTPRDIDRELASWGPVPGQLDALAALADLEAEEPAIR